MIHPKYETLYAKFKDHHYRGDWKSLEEHIDYKQNSNVDLSVDNPVSVDNQYVDNPVFSCTM